MNHMEDYSCENIYYKDGMTHLYTNEMINKLNMQWSDDKIKVILDLNSFLNNDEMASNNVKSLENIMDNNDKTTQKILSQF